MGSKGEGLGAGAGVGKLEKNIYCIKYTLFCFNIVLWLLGASSFGLSLWIRMEPSFSEWIDILELHQYYIGIYILIISSIIIIIVAFIGCGAALMENVFALSAYIITQIFGFLFGLAGVAVLLDYSTYDSKIQPLIRDIFTRFINNPQHDYSMRMLTLIQEEVGCCGADGPNDYMVLRKPLPAECRDTVTGNAFYYGCVQELTWFLEEQSGWLAGVAMACCMIHVINGVMAIVLVQAIRKEDEENTAYKR